MAYEGKWTWVNEDRRLSMYRRHGPGDLEIRTVVMHGPHVSAWGSYVVDGPAEIDELIRALEAAKLEIYGESEVSE